MESGKKAGRKKRHAGICCEKAQTGFGAACRRKPRKVKKKAAREAEFLCPYGDSAIRKARQLTEGSEKRRNGPVLAA